MNAIHGLCGRSPHFDEEAWIETSLIESTLNTHMYIVVAGFTVPVTEPHTPKKHILCFLFALYRND